jgi:hypothetical protein
VRRIIASTGAASTSATTPRGTRFTIELPCETIRQGAEPERFVSFSGRG